MSRSGLLTSIALALAAALALGASGAVAAEDETLLQVYVELGLSAEQPAPSEVVVGLPESFRHGRASPLGARDPSDPVRTRIPVRQERSRAGEGAALAGLPECPSEDAPGLARVHFAASAERREAPLAGLTVRTASGPKPAPGVCIRKVKTTQRAWREKLRDLRRRR